LCPSIRSAHWPAQDWPAIGLVVGAIVVLLYMPIFDLAGDMS
jgi:hypothetical protein